MFEQIVIRRPDPKNTIDTGAFAETLLFYGNVHLLLDGGSLANLVRTIGADNLIRLFANNHATATFMQDNLATYTNTPIAGPPVHTFTAIRIAAHPNGKPYKRKDAVEEAVIRGVGDARMGKIKASQLLRHIKFSEYVSAEVAGSAPRSDRLTDQALNDLSDPDYLRFAIEETLRRSVPEIVLPKVWYFRARIHHGNFNISTDLNFEELNDVYHKVVPPSENSITPAWLVGQVLEARADLFLASEYMSEIATDDLRSTLIKRKFSQFMSRREKSLENIQMFQDVQLSNARAIREAINSGEKSFDEFLGVLERAERFKNWLRSANPDAKLLEEYYDAATSETWAERLPTKLARFAFCTVSGALLEAIAPSGAGDAAGLGLGAADAMWTDKILKGWRPNQFINGPLRRFVG